MTVWISERDPTEVRTEADAVDRDLPLAGRTLAVKDNIDVVGFATTAGCPAYSYGPRRSAPVVERLLAAGVVVAGKTNMDQFATGLVGTRSPYGVVPNPFDPHFAAGGSSSGSAVAVATGLADAALGTDTAGSGRIPAAFCGIVGLKPTRGWLSTRGVVPACRSLDCVTVFAPDVAEAALVATAAAGYDPEDPWSRPAPDDPPPAVATVGVPSRDVLAAWCEPDVLAAFDRLCRSIDVVEIDLWPYLDAGDLLYDGAFVAERYAAVGAFVDAHPAEVDPTVGSIISASGFLSAHALATDVDRLARLRRRAEITWEQVDAVLVPTAPFHPRLSEIASDPRGVNAALGRFTNGCNLLDWCAAAVPAGRRRDGLPFGVMLLGPAWSDRAVWAAAADIVGQPAPSANGARGRSADGGGARAWLSS